MSETPQEPGPRTTAAPNRAGPARAPRADAKRNRERLLVAAKQAFAEVGPDVGLDEIARRTGVGIGTLYRHFPNRDAIVEAVYRREVQQLADAAARLLGDYHTKEVMDALSEEFSDAKPAVRLMAAASYIRAAHPEPESNRRKKTTAISSTRQHSTTSLRIAQ